MSNEGFLRRWSRLKAQGDAAGTPARGAPAPATAGASMQYAGDEQAPDLPPLAQTAPHPPFAPAAPPGIAPRKLPTVDDVAALGPDSDFSAFVSQGVDKSVQRLALKKLFSDPHFNILDGLDVYIDDYNKADPIPAAMLASLDHARSVFARPVDRSADGQDSRTASAGPAGQPDGQPAEPGRAAGQAGDRPDRNDAQPDSQAGRNSIQPGDQANRAGQPEPPQQDDA